jgi:hypothetical protein
MAVSGNIYGNFGRKTPIVGIFGNFWEFYGNFMGVPSTWLHHHHLWWDVTHLIRQSTTDTHLIERHWCIAHQLFIHLQDFTITHHFIPSCL